MNSLSSLITGILKICLKKCDDVFSLFSATNFRLSLHVRWSFTLPAPFLNSLESNCLWQASPAIFWYCFFLNNSSFFELWQPPPAIFQYCFFLNTLRFFLNGSFSFELKPFELEFRHLLLLFRYYFFLNIFNFFLIVHIHLNKIQMS